MPIPPAVPNRDDLIEMYAEGASLQQVADAAGRSLSWAYEHLNAAGVVRSRAEATRRTWLSRRHAIDVDEVIRRHEAGEPVNRIASDLGVARTVLASRFAEVGYSPRGRSEAGYVRMRDPDQRGRVVRRAHLAMGEGNAEIIEALSLLGVEAERERVIGGYNVDLYVAPVVIEVTRVGASPLSPKARERQRLVNLLDRGHRVLFVHAPKGSTTCPLNVERVANALIAYLDVPGGEPPAPGQYRVLRGCGETVAGGGLDDARRPGPRALHRH